LILEKAVHHEGHRGHEEFSGHCGWGIAHPPGELGAHGNDSIFFVFFVRFVVQMRLSG